LKGKAPPALLTVAQATTNRSTTEDHEETAKRRARLATEAIASFDAHASDGHEPTTSYDSTISAGAIYLSDVAARPAHERHIIRPCVVRMVNDTGILVVSRVGKQHYSGCVQVCDDGFESTIRYDRQKICQRIVVDCRQLNSLPIYHRHIHWPRGTSHR
jgi:hypothetical protein